jgi:hypothetical protein
MAWWRRNKGKGSQPAAFAPVDLHPNPNAQYFYQEKQTYNWPSVPAHEQRSALINCWSGNQLPGPTNTIPGVAISKALWNIPTTYANALLKQQQFNKAYNIQASVPMEQSSLMQQALANWQNRVAY